MIDTERDAADLAEAQAMLTREFSDKAEARKEANEKFTARLIELSNYTITFEKPDGSATEHWLVVIKTQTWSGVVTSQDGRYRLDVREPGSHSTSPAKHSRLLSLEFNGNAVAGTEDDPNVVVCCGNRRPKRGALAVTIEAVLNEIRDAKAR